MMKIIGFLTVICCVMGGYTAHGGHLGVLWQPLEFVIIGGAAVGAYIIGNSSHVLKVTGKALGGIFKKDKYGKEEYVEVLTMLFTVFKMARTKGWLSLESHVENPDDSELFKQFPVFTSDHGTVTFLCDYLRIISLGSENPYELDALMDQEIETKTVEKSHVSHAVQGMADALPALGIVAAVLGVIHTMGSITEPPEVLGGLIGAALVGTFAGVFAAYGFVGPVATAIAAKDDAEMLYYKCIKTSLLAFLQGAAPQVAVEFGRKILSHDVQPTFLEVEEATGNATIPG